MSLLPPGSPFSHAGFPRFLFDFYGFLVPFFTVVGFYHRKMYVVLQMSGRDIYNRIKSH